MSLEEVKKLIDNYLSQKGFFLVELKVDDLNRIKVEIDGMQGVKIQDCVDLSRHIEGSLDREKEDFELQVSSAGLDQPLRVYQQYEKNEGREVEVSLKSGQKIKGMLKDVNKEGFVVEQQLKERVEGKKKKQLVVRATEVSFDEVITAKQIIKFK